MNNCYLTPKQMDIIEAFIDCNMIISETAKKLYYNVGTISYHLDRIKMSTGYDPRKVRDLWFLDSMVKEQRKLDNEC